MNTVYAYEYEMRYTMDAANRSLLVPTESKVVIV